MKRYILALLVAGFSYLSMSSFSSGGGTNSMMGNRTGAGGALNSCDGSGCHAANVSDITIDLYLVDQQGDTVKNGKYNANAVYTLRLHARTTGSYPTFGFQLAAEKYVGFAGAGYYVPTPGLQANPVGSYEIIEQMAPIQTTGANNFVKDILWKAPPSGSQTIKFYITVLASNANGFANGDKVSNVQKSYQENLLSVEDFNVYTEMNVYPNPTHDVINLSMKGADAGVYQLQLFDLGGRIVKSKEHTAIGTRSDANLDISALSSGTYFLKVSKEGKQRVLPIIKQ